MSDLKSRVFKRYNPIGVDEIEAVNRVLESGVLSDFYGTWSKKFYGGDRVKKLEEYCSKIFDVKHVISVNSWTSGLECAVGAIGVSPEDEIITTPWTMSATAISILHWNAIPVFCDISPDSYNIDPHLIEKHITSKTKAIMSVDIFGQSADVTKINEIAKKYHLKVISDCAQAIWSNFNNKKSGTLTDIGGYSLNYHKHINCGEGGLIVTDDDNLADNCRLIRNHAESVVTGMKKTDLNNMIGHNFRMGEIEAAISLCQLEKLPMLASKRKEMGDYLSNNLSIIDCIKVPEVNQNSDNVYYVFPIQLFLSKLKCNRKEFIKSLEDHGVPGVFEGYQNLHTLPVFQQKRAFGNTNFPWTNSNIDYKKGICPVAEDLHDNSFIGLNMCLYDFSMDDIQLISNAIIDVASKFQK